MENNERYQEEIYSESKGYLYSCAIKISNDESDSKTDQNPKSTQSGRGWYIFIRVATIFYIIAIFYGIFHNNESLVLLGSAFVFCYEAMTSAWFKRFSRGFRTWTGTTLNDRRFICSISLCVGIITFLLESHFHIISNLMYFGVSGFESLLMGISLILLLYDSRQVRRILPDLDPNKINRIEIMQVFQKLSPEDPS